MTSTVTARTRASPRRDPGRALPLRLGHRGAEEAHDGDHRRERDGPPRRLHRHRRLGGSRREGVLQRRHPHRGGRPGARAGDLRRGQRRGGRLGRRRTSTPSACSRPAFSRSGPSPSSRRWPFTPARGTAGWRSTSPGSGPRPVSSWCPSTRLGWRGALQEAAAGLAGAGACPAAAPRRRPGGGRVAAPVPALPGAAPGGTRRCSRWTRPVSGSTTRPPAARSTTPPSPPGRTATTWSCGTPGARSPSRASPTSSSSTEGERVTPPVSSRPAGRRGAGPPAGRGDGPRGGGAGEATWLPGQRIWLANSVRGLYEAVFVG